MAIVSTTLSAKVAVTDTVITVASNTSIGVGRLIRIDDEYMMVRQDWGSSLYPSSGTVVPVLRGRLGSWVTTHNSGVSLFHGIGATDFQGFPPGVPDGTPTPEQTAFLKYSYNASGALALPTGGAVPGTVNSIHRLVGTSALTMTLAAPDASMDYSYIQIVSDGKGAHVIQPSGNNGVGNAGSGYRNVTFTTSSKQALLLIACNGDWLYAAGVLGGTTTALQGALS